MPPRNVFFQNIKDFFGLNTLESQETLPPSAWIDSNNVVVSETGNPLALRSPFLLTSTGTPSGGTLPTTNTTKPVSIFNPLFSGTAAIFFDLSIGGVVNTYRFTTQTTLPTALITTTRTNQAVARWDSLNINDKIYRVNGTESIQYDTAFTAYKMGLDAPATAPTVTIGTGGSIVLNVGVSGSYAYHNSTTGHVGAASLFGQSAQLASVTTVGSINMTTVASTDTGVDGVVFFISQDAGSERFLLVTSVGDLVIGVNTTGTQSISSNFFIDTNTPETVFNLRPPAGGTQLCAWDNRLWITGFTASTTRTQLVYSGIEAIYAGVQYEAFPELNVVNIPAKTQASMVAEGTPVGLFVLSDTDGYLLTGSVQDNTVSAINPSSVSYRLDSLSWNIGTRSPNSMVVTPYGIIWLDQNKRIQLWNYQGFPQEIGLPLRPTLDALNGADAALLMAEGGWLQDGHVQYYILTAYAGSTVSSESTNNKLFIIGFAKDSISGELQITTAVSDIQASALAIATRTQIIRDTRVLIGCTNGVQEIFDFDKQGDGWTSDQSLYFEFIAGNDAGNYSSLHSIRYDTGDWTTMVQSANTAMVQVRNQDNSGSVMVNVRQDAFRTYKGLINAYGLRKKVKFILPTDDSSRREITNIRLAYSQKRRVI